ncbi:hypothetical protein FB451DRAFT_1362233 [Mycena latifolia]|nr:hypothetical protein FB451DRAFT_1362233 [Mycena latifolia]
MSVESLAKSKHQRYSKWGRQLSLSEQCPPWDLARPIKFKMHRRSGTDCHSDQPTSAARSSSALDHLLLCSEPSAAPFNSFTTHSALDYSTKYSPNPQDFPDLLYIETEKAVAKLYACFKHVNTITIFTSRRRGVRITKLASFAIIISDTCAAERYGVQLTLVRPTASARKVHYLHAYVPPLPLVRVRAERMRAAGGQIYGARFASLCAVAPLASLATALFSSRACVPYPGVAGPCSAQRVWGTIEVTAAAVARARAELTSRSGRQRTVSSESIRGPFEPLVRTDAARDSPVHTRP